MYIEPSPQIVEPPKDITDGTKENIAARLLASRNIEIESFYRVREKDRALLIGRLKKMGFEVEPSTPSSVYYDTDDFQILDKLNATLRLRDGNVLYPAKACFKYVYRVGQEFLNTAIRKRPLGQQYGLGAPIVRTEIEPDYPAESVKELFARDLPEDIKAEICSRMAPDEYAAFLEKKLSPRLITDTEKRDKIKFYYDPDMANAPAVNGKSDDFPFLPQPSPVMIKSGRYVCIEMAIDDCLLVQMSQSATPDLARLYKRNKFRGCFVLGRPHILEVEYRSDHSGKNTSIDMMLDAFAHFELQMASWLQEKRLQASRRHGAEPAARNGHRYHINLIPLTRNLSKAMTGYGKHSDFLKRMGQRAALVIQQGP